MTDVKSFINVGLILLRTTIVRKWPFFSCLPTIVRVLNTNLFSLKRTVERLQFRSSIFVAKSVALGKNVTLDKMQCFK